jgi:polysaccharide export outer membrane protein
MIKFRFLITALVGCILILLAVAAAQSGTGEAELLRKLNKSTLIDNGDQTAHYSTPPIYDQKSPEKSIGLNYSSESSGPAESDSQRLNKQAHTAMDISEGSAEQSIPKPGPEELEIFGSNLFVAESADFSPPPVSSVPADYKLGPGDNVIVYLWGRVDMEMNLTIDREGKVFIPKAGEIVAFDMTLDQFKERLRQKLSNIYSDFELGIMLGKIRTIRVYVYGEVKHPGAYTISSLATLFNALYYAGGPNQNGSLRQIKLNRRGKTVATVDFYDFLLNGNNSGGIQLESEDVIFVPVVGPMVTVRGEVKRPAIYELKDKEKLLDVISLAGGVQDEAYLGRVMIDRINNFEGRKLIDLSLATSEDRDMNNIDIRSGDDISVFAIYERRENVVWLDGHVKHPGAYEYHDSLTISELLEDGFQLKENPYLGRADLIRTKADSRQELIPVDLGHALDKDPKYDFRLKVNDSLRIYSGREVTRQKYVSIAGEIRNPGEYKLFENMRVSDLIFMAGDLMRGAYTLTAEIARRSPGKDIQIIYVDLEKIKNRDDPDADLPLQEDDYVFIRKIPDWDLNNFVSITGEVRFPGKYALFRRDETLYELIQRVGGLTPEAFAFGTVFVRGEIEEKLERMNLPSILDRSNPIRFDSLGNLDRTAILEYNPRELSRMVIDMDLILRSEGRRGNIVLQKGDQIYIPPRPSGVQVTGAVASSGTIHFMQDKKANYYIDRAGGLLPHADKKNIRVIRANGQVVPNGKAGRYHLGLGDVVMVPSKIIKERSLGQTLLTSVSIISSIATTIFIIDRL